MSYVSARLRVIVVPESHIVTELVIKVGGWGGGYISAHCLFFFFAAGRKKKVWYQKTTRYITDCIYIRIVFIKEIWFDFLYYYYYYYITICYQTVKYLSKCTCVCYTYFSFQENRVTEKWSCDYYIVMRPFWTEHPQKGHSILLWIYSIIIGKLPYIKLNMKLYHSTLELSYTSE